MLNKIEKSLVYNDGLLMYYVEANRFDQNDNFNNALKRIVKLHATIEEVEESKILQSINIEKLQQETEKALKKWLLYESNFSVNEMLEHFQNAMNCIHHNNTSRKKKGIELFSNFLKVYNNL